MPRFQKGHAPGPGRPPGCRNRITVLMDELGRDGIEDTIAMLKRQAVKNESLRAAAILLARVWPRARPLGRPVQVALPPVENAAGIVQAHAALIAAVGSGEVAPEEATAISGLLDGQRRALETYDLEKQIKELKAEIAGGADRGPAAA